MPETSPVSTPMPTVGSISCQSETSVAVAGSFTSWRQPGRPRVRRIRSLRRRLVGRHRQHREAAIEVRQRLAKSAVHEARPLRVSSAQDSSHAATRLSPRNAAACAYRTRGGGSSRAGSDGGGSSSPETSRPGGPWAARRTVRRTRRRGRARSCTRFLRTGTRDRGRDAYRRAALMRRSRS